MRSRRLSGDSSSVVVRDMGVITKKVALVIVSLCIALTLCPCVSALAQTFLTLESGKGAIDGRSNAVPIPANGTMIGSLGSYSTSYIDTEDWYRVDIPQRSTFVVSLATAANPGSDPQGLRRGWKTARLTVDRWRKGCVAA